MSDAAPGISVVVPVRDGAQALPELLASLRGSDARALAFEVVVVDNASRDATAEVAHDGGADRVVSEPAPGRARARHAGAGGACRQARVHRRRLRRGTRLARGARRLPRRFAAGCRPGQPDHRHPPSERRAARVALALPPARARGGGRLGGFGEPRRPPRGLRGRGRLRPRLRAHRRGRRPLPARGAPRALPSRIARPPGSSILRSPASPPILRRAVAHGWSSNQHHHRLPGRGRRYWRHPLPALRGDWALRRFGVEPAELPPADRRRLMRLARAEYAARVAGSAWAELRRAR